MVNQNYHSGSYFMATDVNRGPFILQSQAVKNQYVDFKKGLVIKETSK